MSLDVRTLFVQTTITYAFLSLALFLYGKNHKTYPGFKFWLAGMFLATIGYVTVIARGMVPDWVSIIGNNTLFTAAAVIRLDGTMRFMRGRAANQVIYVLPVVMAMIASYFYFIDDQIALRGLFLSIMIGSVCFAIAHELLRYAPDQRSLVHTFCATLFILFALGLITRGVIWCFNPGHGIFQATPAQTIYAMGLAIMELGWMVSFLMLNSQRLEVELKESQLHLVESVKSLTKALSEIKSLEGLLPICSSCKKIRDDRGYWNQLEKYIMMHSDARFTHGICPDCARRHYPEHFDDSTNPTRDESA